MSKVDVKAVKELAEKEFREELVGGAKEKVKHKLRQLNQAQVVVENVQRELEDLYAEIAQGN